MSRTTTRGDGYVLRPRPRWRWVVRGVIVMGLIGGGHYGWGRWAEHQLQQHVDVHFERDTTVRMVNDEDNAARVLEAAALLVVDDSEKSVMTLSDWTLELPLTSMEREVADKAVRQNSAALALVRQAGDRSDAQWKLHHRGVKLLDLARGLWEVRAALPELCEAAALLAHENGDDAEAVEHITDLLVMAQAAELADDGMGHSAALFMEARAFNCLFEMVPSLRIMVNAGDTGVAVPRLRELIDKLLDETSTRRGLDQALRWSRRAHHDAAIGLANGSYQLNNLVFFCCSDKLPGFSGYLTRPVVLTDGLVLVEQATAAIKASEMRNWPSCTRIAGGKNRASMRHPIASWLQRDYRPDLERHYKSLAERRLLGTALAVRLYAAENGAWPKRLADLTPRYLPFVPEDPMAEGGSISYAIRGGAPVIYSVGSDNHDDNGSEEARPSNRWYRWDGADVVVHFVRQTRRTENKPRDLKE